MDKVLDFLKAPFGEGSAIAYTILFYCVVACVLLSFIAVIAISATRGKQRRKIKKQEAKLVELEGKLLAIESKLELINNGVLHIKDEVKTVVDSCNRQLTAALISNFPTREEKNKAELFDRFGNLFSADTNTLERVVNVLKDENI